MSTNAATQPVMAAADQSIAAFIGRMRCRLGGRSPTTSIALDSILTAPPRWEPIFLILKVITDVT
jgi:hypothetical protein